MLSPAISASLDVWAVWLNMSMTTSPDNRKSLPLTLALVTGLSITLAFGMQLNLTGVLARLLDGRAFWSATRFFTTHVPEHDHEYHYHCHQKKKCETNCHLPLPWYRQW